MGRAHTLSVSLFGLTCVVLLAAAPAAGAGAGGVDGAATNTTGDQWRVSYQIDVQQDGVATVTASVNRSVGDVLLSTRFATNYTLLDGGAAIERKNSRKLRWDTDQRQSVRYRLRLGQFGAGTGVDSGIVAFRLWEVMPVSYWPPDRPAPHWRVTLTGPNNWSSAVDGSRIGPNTYELPPPERADWPKDHVAVVDAPVHEWTVDGETYRLVKSPTSDGPPVERITDLVNRTAPIIRSFMGSADTAPKLLIVATRAIESGGVAKFHTTVYGDDSPLYEVESGESVYAHEITHTYQEWGNTYRPGVGSWSKEGSAQYLQHYALRQGGLVNATEYRRMLRADVTNGDSIGDPIDASAKDDAYGKGEAVWAALDVDIRARTGGNRTLGDVFARVNGQSESSRNGRALTRPELLTALRAVTGEDYDTFYHNYVNRSQFPDELLWANYSLAAPISVDHGPLRRSELLDRLRQRERTIDRLRRQLNSSGPVIDVRVAPRDDSESFTVGETAVVTANATGTNASGLSVTHDNRTVALGTDREATLSLDDTGEQTITFQYGNETAETVIDVQPASPPPAVVPGRPSPIDVDGDGAFEDIDGSGSAGIRDVLFYYRNRERDVIRNDPAAFDFDGDGAAGTVFDALALYEELAGGS